MGERADRFTAGSLLRPGDIVSRREAAGGSKAMTTGASWSLAVAGGQGTEEAIGAVCIAWSRRPIPQHS